MSFSALRNLAWVLPSSVKKAAPQRYAGLDGMRGLAVAAVMVYHLFPGVLPGGFIGVDVFFVLSGFLITSLLVDERLRTGAISFRRFWQRRARRLLPALAAVVLLSSTVALAVGGDVLYGIARQVLGAATFTYNWVDLASGRSYFSDSAPELFRNFWSLAVEEQFYVLWPVLLLGVLLLRSPRLRLGVVAAAALVSASLMAAVFVPGADPTRVYFGTDTHAFGLLVGAALALLLAQWRPLDLRAGESALQLFARRCLGPAGLVAGCLLVIGCVLLTDASSLTFRGGLAVVSLCAAVLIWAATAPGSRLGRALDAGPLRWIGRRSYGLYLWHWPVYVLITTWLPPQTLAGVRSAFPGVMTALIATALAALSYRYLEEPVRRHGLRGLGAAAWRRSGRSPRGRRELWIAAAIVAVTVVATTSALVVAPARTSAQIAVDRGAQALAASRRSASAHPVPSAAPSALPPGSDIAAIGDSVMLASAPELQQAFPGIAIDAVVSRQMSSAPALVAAMAKAHTLRPVLVLGLGTNGTVERADLERISALLGSHRELVLVTAQAPRSWTADVDATLHAFAAAHPRTVALADWQSAISSRLSLLALDQIHPGTQGGEVYANTVRAALQQYADRH